MGGITQSLNVNSKATKYQCKYFLKVSKSPKGDRCAVVLYGFQSKITLKRSPGFSPSEWMKCFLATEYCY